MLTALPVAVSLAAEPSLSGVPLVIVPACDDVRARARQVLRGVQASMACATERRSEQRVPFPYPVSLTPVARETLSPLGESFVVLGKQLAEQGLDFYHAHPLPYRHMVAELTCPNGVQVRFLLELKWCRFNQHGLYENGGRFVQCLK